MDVKRKITAKVTTTTSRPSSRPASPTKSYYAPSEPPSFRPKAKVNSTATITTKKSTASIVARAPSKGQLSDVSTSSRYNTASTPRPGSPTKTFVRAPPSTISAGSGPSRLRPTGPQRPSPPSAPATPELRHIDTRIQDKSRRISITRTFTPTAPSPSSDLGTPFRFPNINGHSAASDMAPKVKSKMSRLVTHDKSPTGRSPSPARSLYPRARAASIAPSISLPLPNPSSPPHIYSSPSSPPRQLHARVPSITSKIDPLLIPLPPLSPPLSSLSLSSRSSTSRTSTSYTDSRNGARVYQHDSGASSAVHSAIDSIVSFSTMGTTVDDHHSGDSTDLVGDRKVRAEAKSNRKIADLEITNKSLLAINATLEATKNKQAKEIRDLRRKLRESRLILPPRTYREVKSSLGPEELAAEENDDDEDDEEDFEEEAGAADQAYNRVKTLLDSLLNSGRTALTSQPQEFGPGKGGAKVLTAEEVQSWSSSHPPTSPSLVAVPDSDSDDSSEDEDEVEQMMLRRASRSPTPAIFVTKSP